MDKKHINHYGPVNRFRYSSRQLPTYKSDII